MRDDGPGGPLHRAGALLLIPIAALMIAASTVIAAPPVAPPAVRAVAVTLEAPPAATNVATLDGMLLVGWDEPYPRWASSTDGVHFTPIRVDSPPRQKPEGCVPSKPDLCYRVDPVDRVLLSSIDAGLTWEREWPEWPGGKGYLEFPASLAVFEHDGSYRVFVPSGWDGFAVRAPDGTWSMVPDLGAVAAGVMTSATFPTIGLATLSLAVALGLALFLFSLKVLSLLARKDPEASVPHPEGANVAVVFELLVLGFFVTTATPFVASERPVASGFEWSTATYGTLFAVAASSLAVAVAWGFTVPVRESAKRRVLVSSALVGIAVFASRLFPWPVDSSSMGRGSALIPTALVALGFAIAFGFWRDKASRKDVPG